MASSNSVLNIVIRAKDLAKGALTKVTTRLRGMGRASQQTESRFASLGRSIRNLVIASLGFYTIKKAMQGVLQTGDQFERLQVQLNAIMGSVEEGEQAFEWIKEFTKNTPLELQQVADAFTALKNFGLDPKDGTLQAIVDQTSKLGGGMERLNGISLALGQAWAKQKLQGEEILQLVERGVPVWELLEKVTGKNVQELQKLSSAGKLGRETMKQLIDEIGKSSAGAAADNMSLLSGLMANMADRWTEFKNSVADSGWQAYVKEMLSDIGKSWDEMVNDGRLRKLARSISDGFIAMAESVRLSLSSITIDDLVSSIRAGFTTISSVLGSMRSAFTLTGTSISFFFNSFTLAVKSFGLVFSSAVATITQNAAKMFDAFGADETAKKIKYFSDGVKAIASEFKKEAAEDLKDVQRSWNTFFNEAGKKSQEAQQHVRSHNKKTIDELLKNYPKVEVAVKKTAETAKAAFTDAADALKQINAAETSAELADLGVALAQAFADGTLTQEQYNDSLDASKQKLAELKATAENSAKGAGDAAERSAKKQVTAAESVNTIAGAMAGHYSSISNELNGMSGAAQNAFENMQSVNNVDTSQSQGEIANLKNELKETGDELQRLGSVVDFDVTGISDWMNETASDAAHVKKQFLEQKIALEELIESYEQGSINAQHFVSEGKAASNTMNLLDQQDLDRLNSAIQSAEDGMNSLNDSTRNTLDSLQNELDQLQGKQEDIERRKYENQQRDLKQQQTEAQAKGDSQAVSNITQALSLSSQVYQEQRRQTQKKKQEERLRDKEKRKQENSRINTRAEDTQSKSPQKIIRLEYPGGGVNIGIDGKDETKLLEALKNAGLRSI
ncbi:hypothetical protein ACH42_17060 [Endozoicomonas sp. (ex Bugula neritina AB1)]|nr:hypothetical protein ACH42_17060 [Endozoicomonas sp. (ex Bugula neritina AB1)]